MVVERGQARPIFNDMEHATRNAAALQQELLCSILEKNVGAEYLQRHGLHKQENLVDGFKQLPFVEYADIEAEVKRVADGDTSPILCSDPVSKLFISSGTTSGKSKLIPATEETVNQIHRQIFRMRKGDTCLALWFASTHSYTKGGLKAETVTTSALSSDAFKKLSPAFVTPYQIYQSSNVYECMYCHLLAGLFRSKELTVIISAFAFTVAEAFKMLQDLWPELLDDIRNGSLSPRVTDDSLRLAMQTFARPDPQLASQLSREFESFTGIAERLWPNVRFITTVTTGAMSPYVPCLREYLGTVPLVSGHYFSSECVIGLNLNPGLPPEDVVFTLAPDSAYFEFLPLEGAKEAVSLTNVQVGRSYEIVLTTRAGLYRYRLGDVVRVTGFHNASPTVAFLYRRNVLLSVATDKTDEYELQEVVLKVSSRLRDNQLLDFTSYADFSSFPGHYAIFWELKYGSTVDPENLRECCELLDVSFNHPYMRGRRSHAIGPLELCIVRRGCFKRLFEQHVLLSGAGGSQYKAPRCVRSPEAIQLLRKNTVQNVFSSSEFPETVVRSWKP